MKLLHTADWHIGKTLYGRKRYDAFEAFLNWLIETLHHHDIHALLVAGDVFDTTTPSHRAQQLYYRFLYQVATSACRHVVVIAGNHDSPSLLNAPKELLKALDIHVIGNAPQPSDEEVLVLRNAQGVPELIVCAVPYLRDGDIRVAQAGESVTDKEHNLIEGIRHHYAAVAAMAEQQKAAIQAEYGLEVPLVAMGHLFTTGGCTVEDDGVRPLYIGSLAHIHASFFPACFNYIALGHLHVPQKVNGLETLRYSGSPLPMGFGEATQQKSVCHVEFHGTTPSVRLIPVPVLQTLVRIQGDWRRIAHRLRELSAMPMPVWVEVIYEGDEIIADLRERLDEATAGTQIDVVRIKSMHLRDGGMAPLHPEETLCDLNVHEAFERCLAVHNVPDAQRALLRHTYQEILVSFYETDTQAE